MDTFCVLIGSPETLQTNQSSRFLLSTNQINSDAFQRAITPIILKMHSSAYASSRQHAHENSMAGSQGRQQGGDGNEVCDVAAQSSK